MTLAEYHRLCRYWRRHPPLHLMIAGYLGLTPSSPSKNDAGLDIAGLMRLAPNGFVRADQLGVA